MNFFFLLVFLSSLPDHVVAVAQSPEEISTGLAHEVTRVHRNDRVANAVQDLPAKLLTVEMYLVRVPDQFAKLDQIDRSQTAVHNETLVLAHAAILATEMIELIIW